MKLNSRAASWHASVSPMVHGLLDSGSGNIWPDSVLVTIFYSEEGVPGILRAMLIFGGIAAVGFTYLFGLESTWAHRLMVVTLAAVIGLVLFTIGALGHPFEGGARIGPGFFELVLKRMETSKLSDLR